MGQIGQITSVIFGDGRNAVTETLQVFRENAENGAVRDADVKSAALAPLAAYFARDRKEWFDHFIDGLNRLPRPMLALGTIGLFVSAMAEPVWFAARMAGIATVPKPLWWLMGAIVSFYFGARHQVKRQEFQKQMVKTAAAVHVSTISRPIIDASDNAALAQWQAQNG